KRAYCLKTQPATGETYPKSDLFNKAMRRLKDVLKFLPEICFLDEQQRKQLIEVIEQVAEQLH
ncbi:hypothetical protein, partial [Enterobacter roggenkampii]|uniref:hypothetical protein n=1 Tax=Enterobacter roggenkampii TaxID=1812935 RepID=UPI003A5A5B98